MQLLYLFSKRHWKYPLIFLFVAGAYSLLAYFFFASAAMQGLTATDVVYGHAPNDDSAEYVEIARNLLQEKAFLYAPGVPEHFRTPLYPALLAILIGLFGTPLAVVTVQIALLAATAALIIRIGAAHFSIYTGIIAAIAYACMPSVFVNTMMAYSETLFIFFLVLAAYWMFAKPLSWRTALFCGFTLGTLALTRPIGLYIIPIFLLFLAARAKPHATQVFLNVAVCALASALIIVPWIYRNHASTGYFSISSSGVYNTLFMNVAQFESLRQNISFGEAQAQFDEILGSRDRGFGKTEKKRTLIWNSISNHPFEYAHASAIWTLGFLFDVPRSTQHLLYWGHVPAVETRAMNPQIGNQEILDKVIEPRHFNTIYLRAVIFLMASATVLVHLWNTPKRRNIALFLISIIVAFTIMSGSIQLPRIRMPILPFLYLLAAECIVVGYTFLRAKMPNKF